MFYEYATISIVQDGLRLCLYSMPVTLLDLKVDVVRELIEEAEERGVRVKLLLMDRAFFTVECINLLKGRGVKFVTPCILNERVQRAVDSLGREGILPFSIRDSHQVEEASFTMVVALGKDRKKLMPFATNLDGANARRFVKRIPKEYRRRWGVETSFRKVKEVHGRTLSPSPAIRLAYFMTATILYNLWQAINLMLTVQPGHGVTGEEEDGYRVTMPFMVTILCAHLNGRL
ncbi:MAG: transposase [Nitrososphaerota archaeon]|nr:transposase [Nitrososphaerota archaeon]